MQLPAYELAPARAVLSLEQKKISCLPSPLSLSPLFSLYGERELEGERVVEDRPS